MHWASPCAYCQVYASGRKMCRKYFLSMWITDRMFVRFTEVHARTSRKSEEIRMESGSYLPAMRWSTLVPTNSQCLGAAMSTTYETVKHGRCARCEVKGASFPCILDKTEGATRRMMPFRKESGTRSLGTPFTRLSLYRPLFTRSSTSNWYPRCGMGSNGGRSIRRNHSNLCLSPQRKIESAERGGKTPPDAPRRVRMHAS